MLSRSGAAVLVLVAVCSAQAGPLGYYRQPALHKDVLIFAAEGDLWRTTVAGGNASRLTTHAGEEVQPAISPDGKVLAFLGHYEGPGEVYTMPLAGGRPERRTWGIGKVTYIGWSSNARLLVYTDAYATKPAQQLLVLDISKEGKTTAERVPLAQAADGVFSGDGNTLFFTRLPFQGSHTKRYKGGTAQNLWSFTNGDAEAKPLTANYAGTSKNPLWWQGRVYFVTDRDGSMNIWSMSLGGNDLKQHTKHSGWDVATPSLSEGRIAYQLGADIHLFDIASGQDRIVPIHLDSDFDQTRERWVKNPPEYMSSAHLSPDGSRVAITARGRVFVAPVKDGRLVDTGKANGVRHREAGFLDNKTVLAFSDESGEVELWKLPANGIGAAEQLTKDGDVLRWEAVVSPDGKRIAHNDKNQRLFILDVEKKENRKVDESKVAALQDMAWSPDSKWLAYAEVGENSFRRIKLLDVAENKSFFVTTDRFDSFSPAWSHDGKWLYFLSDRNLVSVVASPWGTYQPEPYFDKKTRIYQLALIEGMRSPFLAPDELTPEKKEPAKKDGEEKKKDAVVRINREGIEKRLYQLPVPAGSYRNLVVNDRGLFWSSFGRGEEAGVVMALAISNDSPEVKTVQAGVQYFEMSRDGKKLLLRKVNSLFVVDAAPAPADLAKKEVNLAGWTLPIVPRDEWRQMFVEAWRLERDYFYDRGMHGNDWPAIRKKYEPLVERVASRAELSDLVAQMVSELAALHIFVRGGDMRRGDDDVAASSLGAILVRDDKTGYRVDHIYQHDPDEPNQSSPLARPEVDVRVGDVIEQINGTPTLSVPDIGQLLRNKAGKQVLLRVRTKVNDASRDVIVKPLTTAAAADLRYHEWEFTRRLATEDLGKGDIGYVHLRAMGNSNFTEFAKAFYPVFTRQGLIIDVRHNRGGNIDSWILGRLMRKAWFYWSQRVGRSNQWNMQYAFRGHIVVLCDADTSSDGEAFCEGIKRLGLGTVIGTRTWGGEIWLTSSNVLVDRGIATAAEFGVFGPEGTWLIEGHGVDPDIVVDNLPHATFKGEDAQLKAAIKHLQQKIKEKPIELPPVPKYPRP